MPTEFLEKQKPDYSRLLLKEQENLDKERKKSPEIEKTETKEVPYREKTLQDNLAELKELLGERFSLFQESIETSAEKEVMPHKESHFNKKYFELAKEKFKAQIKDMRTLVLVRDKLKQVDHQEAKTLREHLKEKLKNLKDLDWADLPPVRKKQAKVSSDTIEALFSVNKLELDQIKEFSQKDASDFIRPGMRYLRNQSQEKLKQEKREERISAMSLEDTLLKLQEFDPKKEKAEDVELELLSVMAAEDELERIGKMFDQGPDDELKAICEQIAYVREHEKTALNADKLLQLLTDSARPLELEIEEKQNQLMADPELISTTANITAEDVRNLWAREEQMKIFEIIQRTRQDLLKTLTKSKFVQFLDNPEKEKEYAQNVAAMIAEAQTGASTGEVIKRWTERFQKRLEKIENRTRAESIAKFCRRASKLLPTGITIGAVMGSLLALSKEGWAEWQANLGEEIPNIKETEKGWTVSFNQLADGLEITPEQIQNQGNELSQEMDKHDIVLPGVNTEVENPASFETLVFELAEKAVQELNNKTFQIRGKEFAFKAKTLNEISNMGELLLTVQQIINTNHDYNEKSLKNPKEAERINNMPYDLLLQNKEQIVCRHMAYGFNQMLKVLIEKKLPQFKGITADEIYKQEMNPDGTKGLNHSWSVVGVPVSGKDIKIFAVDPTYAEYEHRQGQNWLSDFDALDNSHPTISSIILARAKSELPVFYISEAQARVELGINKEEALNIWQQMLETVHPSLSRDKMGLRYLMHEHYQKYQYPSAAEHQLKLNDQEQKNAISAYYLSEFYLQQGPEQWTKALQYAQKSLERAGDKGSSVEQLASQIRLAQFWRKSYNQGWQEAKDNSDPKNPVVYNKDALLQETSDAFGAILDKITMGEIQLTDENRALITSVYGWQADNYNNVGQIEKTNNAFDQAYNISANNEDKASVRERHGDIYGDQISKIKKQLWDKYKGEEEKLSEEQKAEKKELEREQDRFKLEQVEKYKSAFDLSKSPARKLELLDKLCNVRSGPLSELDKNAAKALLEISPEEITALTANEFLDFNKRFDCVANYIEQKMLADALAAPKGQEKSPEQLAQEAVALYKKMFLDSITAEQKQSADFKYKCGKIIYKIQDKIQGLSSEALEREIGDLVKNGAFSKEAYEDNFLIPDIRKKLEDIQKLTDKNEQLKQGRQILAIAKGVYDTGYSSWKEQKKVYYEGIFLKSLKETGLSWPEICQKVVDQLDEEPEKAVPALLISMRGTFKKHFAELKPKEQKILINKISQYFFNPENAIPYTDQVDYQNELPAETRDKKLESQLPFNADITLKEWESYVKELGQDDYYRAEKVELLTKNLQPLIEKAKLEDEIAGNELSKKIFNEFEIEFAASHDTAEKFAVLRDFIRICNKSGSHMTLEDIVRGIKNFMSGLPDADLDALDNLIKNETTDEKGTINNNIGTYFLRNETLDTIWRIKDGRNQNLTDNEWQDWKKSAKTLMETPITNINPMRQLRLKIFRYDYFKNYADRDFYNELGDIEKHYSEAITKLEKRLKGSSYENFDDYILIADYWNKEDKSVFCIKNAVKWLERQTLSAFLEKVKDDPNAYDQNTRQIQKFVKYLTASAEADKTEIGGHSGHLQQLSQAKLKEEAGPYIKKLKTLQKEIADIPANKPLIDGVGEIIKVYDERVK